MEGTPVGILEASAAGLPVISTFHAGIPDVIIHEKTGLLCNEHDYKKMAENMLWVLEHSEESAAMGAAGRKNIKENFSMEKHIGKLNEIIEKAIYG
jgi:glycosyltransferase involved in cell wall biosynthesis